MLNGLLVAQAQCVPINAYRQIKQIGKQYQEWDKNEALNPFLFTDTFRDVAEFGSSTQPQNQQEYGHAYKIGNEI